METITELVQFRYYGKDNPKNYPLDLFTNASSNTMLIKYSPILQVKIQTIPGTKIYFNGSTEPFFIEQTGNLDLDLVNKDMTFSGLSIDETSLDTITNLPNGHFIMTIVYQVKTEEATDNGN